MVSSRRYEQVTGCLSPPNGLELNIRPSAPNNIVQHSGCMPIAAVSIHTGTDTQKNSAFRTVASFEHKAAWVAWFSRQDIGALMRTGR